MRTTVIAGILTAIVVGGWLSFSVAVHGAAQSASASITPADWPLHNRDLFNQRYSPLDEITTANVSRLTLKWSHDAGANIGAVTPLVVDGVMYFTSGSRVFAVNAATGTPMWNTPMRPVFPASGRGPAFGDGKIYGYGSTSVYAVDARTGAPEETFGTGGVLAIVNKALDLKYPGKYPRDLDPKDLGYRPLTTPPTYYNGTVYVGASHSDSHIPGGLMIAADAKTGAIKWVFNTVPQGPGDDGWDVAKDTWVGGIRHGGGVWTEPAIDPELGMIYFNSTNTSPTFDGTARKGMNLFTNSMIALDLATGKLKWYYQTLHHDIWDWDLVSGPVLFDVTAGGRTIKGIGSPGKTCYLYMLDRATGTPINPIVETPVPTTTDIPGEEPWPTQPIPHTARGVPQEPFCATYPTVTDPELAKRVRPMFHPYLANEFVITSPGNTGGANYGPPSFSPRTGLVYVTGKNDAYSIKVKVVGTNMRSEVPADAPPERATAVAFIGTIAAQGQSGMTPSMTVGAYNPATGRLAWYADLPRTTNSGNLVTGGDVVFQGVGSDLYALDARTGAQLLRTSVKGGIRASPLTYQANGKQYVAIVAGNTIFAFGL